MPLVFGGNPSDGSYRDCSRVEDNSSDEVAGYSSLSRNILLLGYKDGFLCIVGT